MKRFVIEEQIRVRMEIATEEDDPVVAYDIADAMAGSVIAIPRGGAEEENGCEVLDHYYQVVTRSVEITELLPEEVPS